MAPIRCGKRRAMRAWLESRLMQVWYGPKQPGVFLSGLERLYRAGLSRSRQRERAALATDLVGRPIIVVGNIVAGGTGKTPLVVRLCRLLSEAGLRPGVISSGYGRRNREYLLVDASHAATEVGDEPLLVARRTGVPVLVGPDRAEAARRLFRQPVDVVISDDGLQRLRLPRRIELCVVDGARGLGNGRLLPAGPLREPPERLESVDAVIVNGLTGDVADVCWPGAVPMRLEHRSMVRVSGDETLDPVAWQQRYAGYGVRALAGIGNPQRFFDSLSALGIRHTAERFPDHHAFTARDFAGADGEVFVMTEKDAVKCTGIAPAEAWYLAVEARLPADWEAAFCQRVGEMIATEQT